MTDSGISDRLEILPGKIHGYHERRMNELSALITRPDPDCFRLRRSVI